MNSPPEARIRRFEDGDLKRGARMGTYPQYGLLLKLGLVRLDQF
jgi:hypothetical protein